MSPAFTIVPPDPPNDGILFVDHAKAGRSGHLGHALVEYEPGCILAFYANCSDARKGHSGDGWMEYKRSEDAGRTWSKPIPLAYSKDTYDNGDGRAVASEKAVRTDDGTVVLFNLEYINPREGAWHPHLAPTCLRSVDGGRTWQGPYPVCDEPGRIYDAMYHDGTIFVVSFCNDTTEKFVGTRPEHVYRLYVSTDGGETFSERSALPLDTLGRGYGTMAMLNDGRLIVYVYNINDERHLDCVISSDAGHTWAPPRTACFEKQIRNPQIAAFKGGFVLHGRSGSYGDEELRGNMVLYTSEDGLTWDAGQFLRMQDAGPGAYSNNLLVNAPADGNRQRLLIQASHAYEQSKTNVLHWWLE